MIFTKSALGFIKKQEATATSQPSTSKAQRTLEKMVQSDGTKKQAAKHAISYFRKGEPLHVHGTEVSNTSTIISNEFHV
jgi:hypothetical protein